MHAHLRHPLSGCVLALAVLLAACGKKPEPTPTPAPAPAPAPAAPDTAPAPAPDTSPGPDTSPAPAPDTAPAAAPDTTPAAAPDTTAAVADAAATGGIAAALNELDAGPTFPADVAYPKTWDDPRVLAQLAKSCAFSADTLSDDDRKRVFGALPDDGEMGPADLLSCKGDIFEQSCVFDPCFEDGESACKPECVKTCEGCGTTCAATCGTCASECHDDACKAACAKTCADCHTACLRDRDHCTTGHCTEVRKACRTKLKADWIAHKCPALCKPYAACIDKAMDTADPDMEKAMTSCKPADAHGCDISLCQSKFGNAVDPMVPGE